MPFQHTFFKTIKRIINAFFILPETIALFFAGLYLILSDRNLRELFFVNTEAGIEYFKREYENLLIALEIFNHVFWIGLIVFLIKHYMWQQ